jgi:hypothetical protein
MQDKRADRRRVLYRPAQLVINQAVLSVRALDISISGMSVLSRNAINTDHHCMVRFLLPENGKDIPIEAPAKILYCVYSNEFSGFRIGLRFNPLTPQVQLAVAQYLRF